MSVPLLFAGHQLVSPGGTWAQHGGVAPCALAATTPSVTISKAQLMLLLLDDPLVRTGVIAPLADEALAGLGGDGDPDDDLALGQAAEVDRQSERLAFDG